MSLSRNLLSQLLSISNISRANAINKPSKNMNTFSLQKQHEENLTGTKKAHKPDGSLLNDSKKSMKKYETWKI